MARTPILGRFGRYLVSGGGAAIVDLGGFIALIEFGAPVGAAAVASFGVALLVNFGLSTFFAFRTAPTLRRFILFAVFALIGLTINSSTTIALVAVGAVPWIGKIGGIGVAFLFNFSINHFLVFRPAPPRTGRDRAERPGKTV